MSRDEFVRMMTADLPPAPSYFSRDAEINRAGANAGAGLDVFEDEPAVNPRLVRLAKQGKVVLLPHMGSATHEGRVAMGEKVIVNIRAIVDGHKPPDRVLPSML